MTATAASYDTQSATITVAEIIPAPQQGRSAKLKDSEGLSYGIWPNRLGNVRPGLSYDIEFSSKIVNGATFRDIKDIRHNPNATHAAQQTAASNNNRAQPARSPAPAAAAPGAGQQGGGSSPGGGSYYRPTSPRDAERMFVVKLAGDFIATGRVESTPESMINLVNNLRDAWHATFGQDEAA